MMVDHQFLLAIGAVGWGLALATYRPIAHFAGWPLGFAQARLPALTQLLALLSIATGLTLALTRGVLHGGTVIILFGICFAIFWSGFLRVGAQSALFFAPLAAASLIITSVFAATGLI